jgi:putative membrane protein
MKNTAGRNDKIIALILAMFYCTGIAGHAVLISRPYMLLLTPFVLLLGGAIVILPLLRSSCRILIWCTLTYLFTFTIEAIGVNTGYVFGCYTYGNTLGVKILGVPLVIGFNWVIAVLGAAYFASRIMRSAVIGAVLTGMLTVIYDVPLEMVAMRLDYWRWPASIVPVSNYLAWFIISAIASYILLKIQRPPERNIPVFYFIIQFFFFVIIDLMIIAGIM